MTTEIEARQIIYERFSTLWGATSPFTFENEAYSTVTTTAWVRLAVRHGVSAQDTLGPKPNRKWMRRGRIILQIFVPRAKGVKAQDTLLRKFREIFEGESFSGVDTTNVQHREIGPDGVWWQTQGEADFCYYETK